MTNSSRTTTRSNICAARPARPATCAGQIQEGGNPFEGPRSRPYPTPAQKQPFSHTLFAKAARELGYKPFPQPSGNLSQAYTNPLGAAHGAVHLLRLLRVVRLRQLFQGQSADDDPAGAGAQIELHRARQFRSDADQHRPLAASAPPASPSSIPSGEEWEQPADLVILSAYTMFNVQLLLLSKIGQPYDPVANNGVIGRNFTHQTISSVNGFFDNKKFNFNPFIASGSIGMCIDEFNGDNFDHGPHGFVGGGYMGQVQTNGRPIQTTPVPPGHAEMGRGMEDGGARQLSQHGEAGHRRARQLLQLPRHLSRPRPDLSRSLRPSADAHDDRFSRQRDQAERLPHRQIRRDHQGDGRARRLDKQYRKGPYDITDYQTTHLCGGAIMGTDPKTSALNRYLQSWDVPNLFVMGASAFPQNAGYNPTGTVAALAYWAAAAIRNQYLKNPGPLVDA